MNYRLAKQLKEAGFPQKPPFELWCITCEKWRDIGCLQSDLASFDKHEREAVKIPTLSELIEACGEDFYALFHDQMKWEAWKNKIDGSLHRASEADTPEEAVALLWLEINKEEVINS